MISAGKHGAGALVGFIKTGIGPSFNQTGHSLLRGTAFVHGPSSGEGIFSLPVAGSVAGTISDLD